MISKSLLGTLVYTCFAFVANAQNIVTQPYRLDEVRLLPSPFLSAEQTDLAYMLKLNPDKLLSPFFREAKLQPKAPGYGNWENTGLDGHTAGHYLTALAQMYAANGSAECKKRLDYMISELARCQESNGNGYVGGVPGGMSMWSEVKAGNFNSFNQKWVPWYNLHKLFAGLRDAYLLAGNEQAKNIFIKLADWADYEISGLTDVQVQSMLNTEHGGMDEVLADAYAMTREKKYLLLAERFCHKKLLDPLEQHRDQLTGLHANTQIPKVIGFERIAELSHDTVYSSAARFFWQTVVNNRSVSIGGNSVREHFNPSNDFASMLESEQGPETCNSNNMLKLSKMLFLDEGKAGYIDFYERLLYNHILSSQHPVKGGFVYFTPIHPQHYRVYSTADESFWCCVGTGMENHGKYGELIYTHTDKDVYVNLFIPSVLNWKQQGVIITQQNKFPDQASSSLVVDVNSPKQFTLFVRKPFWVTEGGFVVKLNGNTVKPTQISGNYAGISRVWHKGDRITVDLPMKTYAEYLPDHSNWVSFVHGPVVLAAPTDTTGMSGLFADDSRWGHIAGGALYPLSTSPLLVKQTDNLADGLTESKSADLQFQMPSLISQSAYKNLKLIPFYKVHDTRYVLYWPVTSAGSVKEKEAELSALDEKYLKLAPRTIDQVSPGEQQPENDHRLQAVASQTGTINNLHWRSAGGSFSYQLRRSPAAKTLRIAYYAKDKGCEFDILINGNKIAHLLLDGTAQNDLAVAEYPLPVSLPGAQGSPLTVSFIAANGSATAKITDVRIMR
ncbi:glycosyl hydrolase [Mucilaginibacter sp. PPCGB 2223]|uniref:glycoside hydrolase family 127 protein n=1 Tax=Mucilaginibacter sp. PPCGB 2223 TaxID=1886027 RepID=UPI00082707DA|nr:glycoside hydrolase family 127 protein [Mucilaginibacter sp. PPCGB 2223]OCX53009.1 glycosyl hydrolase [Mucilaginibacter sp. PPCGB 2223]